MIPTVYNFIDGSFVFHVAQYGSWAKDARVVFRVRIDRDKYDRAKEKGIVHYDRIFFATSEMIDRWIAEKKAKGSPLVPLTK